VETLNGVSISAELGSIYSSSDTRELHVDISPQAGVEEKIPTRVMVVVVDKNFIAVPSPVAAAIEVIGSDNPI
jgi:hypothetical protein